MNPPLAETFAGAQGRWRVVDMAGREDVTPATRFAVVMLPLGAPAPSSLDDRNFEVELCRVQYKPHADAIAALPELASALADCCALLEERGDDGLFLQRGCAAIAKAEARS